MRFTEKSSNEAMSEFTCPRTFQIKMQELIRNSGKSHIEIARAMGSEQSTLIDMIMKGTARITLAKVGPLAVALGIDPGAFILEWIDSYIPDLREILDEYFCLKRRDTTE